MSCHANRADQLRRRFIVAVGALGLAPVCFAQAFPERVITIINPYPPGGSTDITGRVLANKLTANLGQNVVVESRGGASGNIGSALAARAPADGYTLLLGTSATHGANVSMFKNMGYDPIKDFAPISLVARTIIAFCVHPSLPVNNMAELIEYAKARPGKLAYGSSGVGSPHHLAGKLLNHMTGTKLVHTSYRGGGPALQDLIGGHIPIGVMTLSAVLPQMKSGALKVLAITEPSRFPLVANLPTVAETLPGYEMSAFHAFYAPAGTPKPIIELLSREIRRALNASDVRDQLQAAGFAVVGSTPDELGTFMAKDIAARATLIKTAGITPE